MTKEERLEYLLSKKKKLKEFNTFYEIDEFYSFVLFETEYEKHFIEDNNELKVSFMWDRLINVKRELKTAIECKHKNKNKSAIDFWDRAIRHINNDYNTVIGVFKSRCFSDK